MSPLNFENKLYPLCVDKSMIEILAKSHIGPFLSCIYYTGKVIDESYEVFIIISLVVFKFL